MALPNKYVLIGGAVALIVAFSAGRFSSPVETKTVVQEKIVYKEKVDDTKAKDTVTKITQTKKPDGTVITVTDKETKTDEHKTTAIDQTTSLTKTTTTSNRPGWLIGLGYNPTVPGIQPMSYQAIVQRRLFSEVYAGVSASSTHTYGVVLSAGF